MKKHLPTALAEFYLQNGAALRAAHKRENEWARCLELAEPIAKKRLGPNFSIRELHELKWQIALEIESQA